MSLIPIFIAFIILVGINMLFVIISCLESNLFCKKFTIVFRYSAYLRFVLIACLPCLYATTLNINFVVSGDPYLYSNMALVAVFYCIFGCLFLYLGVLSLSKARFIDGPYFR